ncbi:MAG: SsrA-binding protein SmpB [Lentisphaerae bacterium]|nr:SsrA-binding protein SmpB [Lentisphaerota bacterium]
MANGKKKSYDPGDGQLTNNRKALHDYIVLEQYEAGIQLSGTEVKSCRARTATLSEAYVDFIQGSAFLVNAHIAGYDHGNRFNHDTRRKRRLLLHRKELLKLSIQVKEKGCTIIPLRMYLKHGLIKVAVALCKGKSHEDKRETLRERQDDMDARRAMRGDRNL